MAKKILMLIATVAILGIGFVLLQPKPTDQQLIQNALDDAIQVGKDGRPGSVLEHLSESFEINGQQIVNRTEIARFIRDQRPSVEVTNMVAEVNGETATITSPVTLELSGPMKFTSTIPNAKIEFTKEQTMRFLLIPDRQWRLTKVTVPPESWGQMMMGL